MNCPQCGCEIMNEEAIICPSCGVPLEQEQTPPKKKKKKPWWLIVLLILGVLLLLPIVLVVVAVIVVALVMVVTMLMTTKTIDKATPMEPITTVTTAYYEEYDEYPEISIVTDAPKTEPQTVTMPLLVGSDAEEAQAYLNGLGLQVVLAQAYNDAAVGCVISQSHTDGDVLMKGDTVTLVVSEGPEYQQKVVVVAPQGSSYGKLVLYDWADGVWNEFFSCEASVGKNGIGSDYGEGKGISPEGEFKIGVALAASGVNTYDWPVERVTLDTCIVDDVNSPYYNTIQSISSLPDGVHYDTIGNTLINGFSEVCIFIEHNGNGYTSDGVVAGKGSVITICSKSSALEPTAGCVDISTGDMFALLSMLDTAKNPHIEIKAD